MSTMSKRQPLFWGLGAALVVVLVVARAPAFSGIALGAFILSYVCAPAVDLLARRLRRPFAVAVIGAGEMFGFVGMLLAVPAAAVIKVLLAHARCSCQATEGYTASAPGIPGLPPEPAPVIADPLPGKDPSPP